MSFPSAVLLDAGGTLIGLDYEWFVGELAALGVCTGEGELVAAEADARAWANDEVTAGVAPPLLWRGYFERILDGVGLHGPRLGPLIDRLRDLNRTVGLWRTPIPGVDDALRELRSRGLRLAAVSNAEGKVEADLREAGFASHLEFVLDSQVVGSAKPDPEIFRIALRRLGLPPEAVLHVGDVYAIDVVGARAAGMDAVLVDPADRYLDADCPRIRTLAELPRLLDGQGRGR
jgi:putative hydrolase of the HAD superfamily